MNLIDLSFSNETFWNKYYTNNKFSTIDWYFKFQEADLKLFKLSSLPVDSEILILGCGTSSIIDYFLEKKYTRIIFVDFSTSLIDFLTDKYLNKKENASIVADWDCKLTL
jgi:hypothetical protein